VVWVLLVEYNAGSVRLLVSNLELELELLPSEKERAER
jgi:hypothetical protein